MYSSTGCKKGGTNEREQSSQRVSSRSAQAKGVIALDGACSQIFSDLKVRMALEVARRLTILMDPDLRLIKRAGQTPKMTQIIILWNATDDEEFCHISCVMPHNRIEIYPS